MKTTTNKSWRRRSMILAMQVMILTLAFTLNGYGQDVAKRISNTESLFEQMKVHQVDTNYTHRWNEDSSRWELYNREIKLYKEKNLLIGILNERYNYEDMGWENYDRSVRSYDEKSKLIESLNQKWSPERDKWVNLH